MNHVNANPTNVTSENDVALPGHWLSPDGIQPLPKHDPAPGTADTAQEAVHEVTTRPAAQDLAPVVGSTALRAARGDDDAMSKPPTLPTPGGKGGRTGA